jgi:large subunit ribosomal protein L10Ae
VCSKIQADILEEAVAAILVHSLETKKRNFLETVELQIALKNYDPTKDKRFSGTVVLPHVPRDKFTICVIGDQRHLDEAKANGIPCKSQDELKLLKKDKKLVKKLARSYNGFLASSSLIRKIPRILGPGLNKAGKFPAIINNSDTLTEKVASAKATIKIQLKSKKTLCLAMAVGNVGMTKDDIIENIFLAMNTAASLLPKNWQQIKRVTLKSTMGPPQRVFGF